jgi:signal transduction histidine kinase
MTLGKTVAALRRVERDLHDGAQVRLAAVAMNLGMAQEKASDGTLRDLLDAAQDGVGGALADLRRIARGIHPPFLTTIAEQAPGATRRRPLPF